MNKLRRLEISRGYVALLKESDELRYFSLLFPRGGYRRWLTEVERSKEALKNVSSTPQLALEPYARLKSIVSSLKAAQPAAEGAAPHLVDYVEKLAMGLREHMKQDFTSRLQKNLEQMKWPSKDLQLSEDLLAQWRSNVELLLGLQTPYEILSFQDRAWNIL